MAVTLKQAEKQRAHLIERFINDPQKRYTAFRSAARGVNHVVFLTDDLEGTIEFYTQVARLKLLRVRVDDTNPRTTQVFFDMGRGELLAFLRVYNIEKPAKPGLGGFHHLAFTVNRPQADALKKRLTARKIPFTTISHEILETITTKDPNGIVLEFSRWKIDPRKVQM